METIVAVVVFLGMLTIALYGVFALSRSISANIKSKVTNKAIITTVTPEEEKMKNIVVSKLATFKEVFATEFKQRGRSCLKFMGVGGLISVIAAGAFALFTAPHLFGVFFFGSSLVVLCIASAAASTAAFAVLGFVVGAKRVNPVTRARVLKVQ
jgi:hypothetical protein